MNCSIFKANFSAYLEGELNPEVTAACADHLADCTACSRLVKAYRTGVSGLDRLDEIEPPADLFERVMAAAKDPGPAEVFQLGRPRHLVPLAAAAALILAVTFGMFQHNNERFDLALDETPVDSTMDVVTVQMLKELPKEMRTRPAQKAYLASYSPDDEAVFSYGVSNHPVIVESGVSRVSE